MASCDFRDFALLLSNRISLIVSDSHIPFLYKSCRFCLLCLRVCAGNNSTFEGSPWSQDHSQTQELEAGQGRAKALFLLYQSFADAKDLMVENQQLQERLKARSFFSRLELFWLADALMMREVLEASRTRV